MYSDKGQEDSRRAMGLESALSGQTIGVHCKWQMATVGTATQWMPSGSKGSRQKQPDFPLSTLYIWADTEFALPSPLN